MGAHGPKSATFYLPHLDYDQENCMDENGPICQNHYYCKHAPPTPLAEASPCITNGRSKSMAIKIRSIFLIWSFLYRKSFRFRPFTVRIVIIFIIIDKDSLFFESLLKVLKWVCPNKFYENSKASKNDAKVWPLVKNERFTVIIFLSKDFHSFVWMYSTLSSPPSLKLTRTMFS